MLSCVQLPDGPRVERGLSRFICSPVEFADFLDSPSRLITKDSVKIEISIFTIENTHFARNRNNGGALEGRKWGGRSDKWSGHVRRDIAEVVCCREDEGSESGRKRWAIYRT